MARALHLIQELGCGEITSSAFDCSAGAPREGKRFTASLKRINAILGIRVPVKEVMRILKNLNFDVKRDGDTLDVTAPRYREDIEVGEPDLAEEVIREYGYDHVVPTFLKSATVTSGGKTPDQQRRERVCRVMCGQGYHEVYTLSFYADSDLDFLRIPADAPERNVLRIRNPISANLAIMRPLLIPSLMNIVVDNLKKGNNEGRIFELSKIYVPGEDGAMPDERPHLGFAAFGDQEDFFTVKGTAEALAKALGLTFEVERAQDVPYLHPGIAAYLLCEGERIGCFGKLANEVTAELKLHKDAKSNHKIFLGEIDYGKMMSHMAASFRYRPLSPFPPVFRDLALTVAEETPCGDLMHEIARACPQVGDVELFDIYRGEQIGDGRKSMAFKIRFDPEDKALSPEEVDRFIKKILGNLRFKLGAEIR
jgi:phenylalanyl-tRNA synthetase beta chain